MQTFELAWITAQLVCLIDNTSRNGRSSWTYVRQDQTPQFRRRSDFVHGGAATLTEMEGKVLAPPVCDVAMEDTLCLGVVECIGTLYSSMNGAKQAWSTVNAQVADVWKTLDFVLPSYIEVSWTDTERGRER